MDNCGEEVSEIIATDHVSQESRRIRDSIEFTSMTHTARQNLNLDEMSEIDEDRLSQALLSELRAIANGNFELCGEPLVVST